MSFLIENIYRQVPRVSRVVAPRVLAGQAPRAFSTSLVRNRTATDTVKDGLKSVDRAVSHKIVDGIEAGENLTHKIQEGMEGVTTEGKMAGKAEEVKGETKAKASEWEGKAKGAAEHAKGAAERAEGKVKGAAEHVKGKVKGAAEDVKSKM